MEIRGSNGYQLTEVEAAQSARARFRGLMLRRPVPLLVRTSMVHGFWLRGPLWLVGVAADGTVRTMAILRRRRMVRLRGVEWILELPPHSPRPQLGERLAFHRPGGKAVPDAGTSVPLRHPYRQPR